ncbi:MAG: hypothetical protein ACI33P_06315 [Lysinibacillus sp.]
MANYVYEELTAKGLAVTEEESESLKVEWENFLALKKDFAETSNNQEDIFLTNVVTGGGK